MSRLESGCPESLANATYGEPVHALAPGRFALKVIYTSLRRAFIEEAEEVRRGASIEAVSLTPQ